MSHTTNTSTYCKFFHNIFFVPVREKVFNNTKHLTIINTSQKRKKGFFKDDAREIAEVQV